LWEQFGIQALEKYALQKDVIRVFSVIFHKNHEKRTTLQAHFSTLSDAINLKQIHLFKNTQRYVILKFLPRKILVALNTCGLFGGILTTH